MLTLTLTGLFLSPDGFSQSRRIKVFGNVRDADGNPLDLVAVQVRHSLIGTMTNEEGYYSLSVSSGDSLVLLFSCLGYNRAERIIPDAAQDVRVNVQMNYTSIDLGEVTVTSARRQTTSMETIDAGRLKVMPDPSGGNIESLVVTHAGVSSNNELSSQYSVRGGSYDENIVYVNGMEVFRPLLIRSGEQEGLSFINPEMTEAVQFSAGGFEARYGDKMSSALDITYKQPKAFEASASASLMGASAYVGSAVGKCTQVSGLRYKTGRSLLSTLDTDADYDPNFMDFQTYWTYRPASAWELNFLGNMSLNNYRFIPHTRETVFGTADNPQKFMVGFDGMERDRFRTFYGALTLKRRLGENSEVGLQAFAFNSSEEETYDITGAYWMDVAASGNSDEEQQVARSRAGYHEHARNRLSANVAHAGIYGVMQVDGKHTLKWCGSVQHERMADKISEWESRDSSGYSLPQTGRDVNVIANLFSDNRLESVRYAAYVQDVFKFRTAQGLFTVVGGVRGSYWSYNREFIFSPRLSAGFIPNANQDWTFRLATGVYCQSPFYKELRVEAKDERGNSFIRLNNHLRAQRSIHLIGGGDYTFRAVGRPFKLTTEIYYKKLDDINPYTVDNVKIRYYGENCAKGYIAGVDMKIFGEMVPGTDSWLSLSLMKAEQTIRGITKAPLPNSQGYNLSLYFQDYFPGYRRAMLNLKGVLAGGFPVTAYRKGYEDGYYRTPPYRRVDIGMTYQLAGGSDAIMERSFFRHFKNIWLGVDVFNLLDIRNTHSYYWITDVYNEQHSVPNYLTGRQINIRISVDI